METTYDVVHWVSISVRKDTPGGKLLEFHKWSDLRWDIRIKWDWYYKYRAALCQVKYPKDDVHFSWGHEKPSTKTEKDILINKISSKQGQVTKFENQKKAAISHWNEYYSKELFQPDINEDSRFVVLECKIVKLKKELSELNEKLKN